MGRGKQWDSRGPSRKGKGCVFFFSSERRSNVRNHVFLIMTKNNKTARTNEKKTQRQDSVISPVWTVVALCSRFLIAPNKYLHTNIWSHGSHSLMVQPSPSQPKVLRSWWFDPGGDVEEGSVTRMQLWRMLWCAVMCTTCKNEGAGQEVVKEFWFSRVQPLCAQCAMKLQARSTRLHIRWICVEVHIYSYKNSCTDQEPFYFSLKPVFHFKWQEFLFLVIFVFHKSTQFHISTFCWQNLQNSISPKA